MWSIVILFQHVNDIARWFMCSYTTETYVNFILRVHVANLLEKTVKFVLPRGYTDCTSGKGKIVMEWLKCETSYSVTVSLQEGKSSKHIRCVAHELHPQAGPFVDANLSSELTVHLQQFPSSHPLCCLSE